MRTSAFPHNPVFVRNLLNAYHDPTPITMPPGNRCCGSTGLKRTDLRSEFFEYSRRMETWKSELNYLRQTVQPKARTRVQWDEIVRTNPAAGEFVAQAELWRSHFEDSAPRLRALAAQYPADSRDRSYRLRRLSLAGLLRSRRTQPLRRRSKTICCRRIPATAKSWRESATSMPTVISLHEAAPYWDRIPRSLPASPLDIWRLPASTGTISILITLFVC